MIPTSVWDYSSGKFSDELNNGFQPEIKQLNTDIGLKNKLEEFKNNKNILRGIKDSFTATPPRADLSVHMGAMTSGSAVIASKDYVDQMIKPQSRKIIGIEMEIYGVFYACQHTGNGSVKFFAMKSVVDYADDEKSDNFHDYACFVSANAVEKFALNYLL